MGDYNAGGKQLFDIVQSASKYKLKVGTHLAEEGSEEFRYDL